MTSRTWPALLFLAAPLVALVGARAPEEPAPETFRARCTAFWAWFGEHADESRAALLAGDAAKKAAFQRELQARLDALVPGMRFGADVGATADSLRIDLAPGRDRTRQLLGRELAASMPTIAGWSCAPWRPPADPSRALATVGKVDLLPRDVRAYCEWDGETPRLSVAVWHDHFARMSPADRQTFSTHCVERLLGAAMCARTPHDVSVLESAPAADAEGVVAGDELHATLVAYLETQNFDAARAPELVEEYYGPPSGERAPGTRIGDVLSGASRYTDLVADLNLGMGTSTVDALAKLGAGAGYVGVTLSLVRVPLDPESAQAWMRAREGVAEALDTKLTAAHAGTVVGWGDGLDRAWIDVVYFDEAAAVAIVRDVLAADARVTAAERYAFDPAKPAPLGKLK